MLHVVQFSGGAASAYVAKLVIDQYGKENTILLFHDTKAEDEDARRFRDEVADYLGLAVTEVSDGRSLWELIDDNHCLPSFHIPFCTTKLKQEPGERFIRSLSSEFTLYNGFDINEWPRVQRAVTKGETVGRVVRSLLFEMRLSSEDAKRVIREDWGICLPRAYKVLNHNNCVPCFKGGQSHFRKVWKYYPDAFARAVDVERRLDHTVFKGITLVQLAARWAAEGDQLMLAEDDVGIPCLCAGG